MPPVRRSRRPQLTAVPGGGPPIQSVADGRSKKINLLVYGEPGIGKTRLAGTCGELGPVLILRPPVDHTDSIVNTTNVDEWVLRDWGQADDALLYLRTDGAEKYQGGWVWVDSLSLWQDQGLDDIWEQLITSKPHRKQWGLDKGEYHVNMQRIGRWIRHLVGTPYFHLGITCHAHQGASTEDEEDPQNKLMPWVQGKMMAPKVCGYMNMVGYYHWEKVHNTPERVLSLTSTDQYYAKDQFDCTPNGRLRNPTMPKLIEAVVNSRKSAGVTATNSSRRTKRRRAAR